MKVVDSLLTQQKTVNEYDQRQYSVNDLQREKLLENSRFVYSKINCPPVRGLTMVFKAKL